MNNFALAGFNTHQLARFQKSSDDQAESDNRNEVLAKLLTRVRHGKPWDKDGAKSIVDDSFGEMNMAELDAITDIMHDGYQNKVEPDYFELGRIVAGLIDRYSEECAIARKLL